MDFAARQAIKICRHLPTSRLSPSLACWTRRTYALQAAAPPVHQVFNRRTKWLQRERAARDVENSRISDYLKDEVAMRVTERLLVRRNPQSPCVSLVSCLGCPTNLSCEGHQTSVSSSAGLRCELVQHCTGYDPRQS